MVFVIWGRFVLWNTRYFQDPFFWGWIHDFISFILKSMRVSFLKFHHWRYICLLEKSHESFFNLDRSNFQQTFVVFFNVCRLLTNWLDFIVLNFSLMKCFLQYWEVFTNLGFSSPLPMWQVGQRNPQLSGRSVHKGDCSVSSEMI